MYSDVVSIGHTFLYRQKSIKKTPNGKNSLLLLRFFNGNEGHLAFAGFVKIDFSSDSFLLAWAFVAV
jgi:hypothetical protein